MLINKEIIVRNARLDELNKINHLYDLSKEFMYKNNNFTQWNKDYPNIEVALNDLNKNSLYVIIYKEEIIGVFTLILDIDETYNLVKDKIYNSPYGVIHRIASNFKFKGIFNIVLKYSLTKINHLLIDTHKDNLIMLNLIKKAGFKELGIIYTDNTPRIAFELNIEK